MTVWAAAAAVALCACGQGSASDDDGDDDDAPDASAGTIDADPTAPDGATPPIDASLPDGGGAVTDPGMPGTWDVHATNTSAATELGNAAVTVYSPSTDSGATPAAGPFPLVIVSTGFQIGKANYEDTCRHLASWGYVVLIHDYTSGNHQEKGAEIGDLIDWATAAGGPITARVDATRIAVAGHSMGGKVSVIAAILDARIDAVVAWDPVDALPPIADGSTSVCPETIGQLDVPFAVLGETTDGTAGIGGQACAPTADNFQQFFTGACDAPAALEVTIANADHTDWVDDRSSCGLACLFCQTGQTPDATVLTITRRVTVAWLETHLRGLGGFGAYLAAPGIGSPATVRTVASGC